MDTSYLKETAGSAISSASGALTTANGYVSNVFNSEYLKYFIIFVVLIVVLVIGYILYNTYNKGSLEIVEIFENYGDNKNSK